MLPATRITINIYEYMQYIVCILLYRRSLIVTASTMIFARRLNNYFASIYRRFVPDLAVIRAYTIDEIGQHFD